MTTTIHGRLVFKKLRVLVKLTRKYRYEMDLKTFEKLLPLFSARR